MRYFCTYFDSGYLPRALALYASLRRHAGPFRLWALCFDEPCYRALAQLDLPGVEPIALADFERGDEALLAAKPTRSPVEYFFTCTPSLPLYVLRHHPEVDLITYLDADLFFFADPAPLFDELGAGSVSLIAHRFPPALAGMEANGRYNVGWLSFRRDERGLACLRWWRERCIEWCYDRAEPGRFADQKYLDEWPARFAGVVELQHRGANVAPWNLATHPIEGDDGAVLVGGDPLIFYHFHGLKRVRPWLYDASARQYRARLSPLVRRAIYAPYIRALRAQSHAAPQQGSAERPSLRASALRRLLRLGRDVAAGQCFLALPGAVI